MTVPSVSKIGLPGPQSVGSTTGGWFVSICHGELGATAGINLRALTSFLGGSGFSLGKNCASAKSPKASNTNTSTIVFNEMNGFMIFCLFFRLQLIFWKRGSGRGKSAAEEISPPSANPFTTKSLEKILKASQVIRRCYSARYCLEVV